HKLAAAHLRLPLSSVAMFGSRGAVANRLRLHRARGCRCRYRDPVGAVTPAAAVCNIQERRYALCDLLVHHANKEIAAGCAPLAGILARAVRALMLANTRQGGCLALKALPRSPCALLLMCLRLSGSSKMLPRRREPAVANQAAATVFADAPSSSSSRTRCPVPREMHSITMTMT
ncbi:hypothetical protein Dimus_037768, partial [Dionaea muscipula]